MTALTADVDGLVSLLTRPQLQRMAGVVDEHGNLHSPEDGKFVSKTGGVADVVVAAADKLKLGKRAPAGFTVRSSKKLKTDYADVVVAEVDGPDGPQVRVGVITSESGRWDAGFTAESRKAKLREQLAGKRAVFESDDEAPDDIEDQISELQSELEELDNERTAILPPETMADLRRQLGEALGLAKANKAKVDADIKAQEALEEKRDALIEEFGDPDLERKIRNASWELHSKLKTIKRLEDGPNPPHWSPELIAELLENHRAHVPELEAALAPLLERRKQLVPPDALAKLEDLDRQIRAFSDVDIDDIITTAEVSVPNGTRVLAEIWGSDDIDEDWVKTLLYVLAPGETTDDADSGDAYGRFSGIKGLNRLLAGLGGAADAAGTQRAVRPLTRAADVDVAAWNAANPAHLKGPDGKWADVPGAPTVMDKLKGAGRIDLEPGERLLKSDRVKGENGRAWLAVTEKDGRRSLRIGLGNANFGTRHGHGGPWRAGPDRSAEINEERAELRALMEDLEDQIDDIDDDPDGDPADLAELRAQLEGYEEDLNRLGDVDELPGGYTAMLDETSARQLRETLAKALDDGETLQAELDKPYQEIDRLTLQRDELKRKAMGRKFTDEEDAEWDRLTAEIARAQAELDPTSGPERPEAGYWTLAVGSIPGQWADVHYDIYLDDPDVGVEVKLGAVPHGSDMDFDDMRGAEMTASFDIVEAGEFVKLLAKLESVGSQRRDLDADSERALGRSWTRAVDPDGTSVVHTGAMVALIPTESDAARLAVDGGEPADQLHLTLRFLGKGADFPAQSRQHMIELVREYMAGIPAFTAKAFNVAVFNPDGDEPCIVLGVGGDMVETAYRKVAAAVEDYGGDLPEPHKPFVAHLTLAYTGNVSMVEELVDRVGPITFDRVRLVFAEDVTDIPLRSAAPMPEQTQRTAAQVAAAIVDTLVGGTYTVQQRQARAEFLRMADAVVDEHGNLHSPHDGKFVSKGRVEAGKVLDATGKVIGYTGEGIYRDFGLTVHEVDFGDDDDFRVGLHEDNSVVISNEMSQYRGGDGSRREVDHVTDKDGAKALAEKIRWAEEQYSTLDEDELGELTEQQENRSATSVADLPEYDVLDDGTIVGYDPVEEGVVVFFPKPDVDEPRQDHLGEDYEEWALQPGDAIDMADALEEISGFDPEVLDSFSAGSSWDVFRWNNFDISLSDDGGEDWAATFTRGSAEALLDALNELRDDDSNVKPGATAKTGAFELEVAPDGSIAVKQRLGSDSFTIPPGQIGDMADALDEATYEARMVGGYDPAWDMEPETETPQAAAQASRSALLAAAVVDALTDGRYTPQQQHARREWLQRSGYTRHPAPPPHEQWMHAGKKKVAGKLAQEMDELRQSIATAKEKAATRPGRVARDSPAAVAGSFSRSTSTPTRMTKGQYTKLLKDENVRLHMLDGKTEKEARALARPAASIDDLKARNTALRRKLRDTGVDYRTDEQKRTDDTEKNGLLDEVERLAIAGGHDGPAKRAAAAKMTNPQLRKFIQDTKDYQRRQAERVRAAREGAAAEAAWRTQQTKLPATDRQVDYIMNLLARRRRSGDGGGFFNGPTDRAGVAKLSRADASAYINSLTDNY